MVSVGGSKKGEGRREEGRHTVICPAGVQNAASFGLTEGLVGGLSDVACQERAGVIGGSCGGGYWCETGICRGEFGMVGAAWREGVCRCGG